MTETRKDIIDFLYNEEIKTGKIYMNKKFDYGCFVECFRKGYEQEKEIHNIHEGMINIGEGGFTFKWIYSITKIIGHYDMTAILSYIDENGKYISVGRAFDIREYDKGNTIGLIPNKPLNTFTEKEEIDLLNLLLKINGQK